MTDNELSIIVPIKKIPEECFQCPCYSYRYREGKGHHYCGSLQRFFDTSPESNPYGDRPTWCPITEIPGLGRLIKSKEDGEN